MKLDEYKNWLILKGNSEKTIENYLCKVAKFLEFLKDKQINQKNVNEFFLDLKNKISDSSFNNYRMIIKSYLFFKQLKIAIPPKVKTKRKIPKTITLEYFEKEIIPTIQVLKKNSLQIKAILYFMFFTGIRVGEIDYLKREHINLTRCIAKIYGKKTKEEREVIFSDKTRDILEAYFSSEPETINAFNMTSKAIQKMFERLKSYFKKDINFNPHLLRHSFGRYMISKGIDSEELRKLMGHSDIKTTQIYLSSIGIEDIKKKYDKLIN